MTKSEVVNTKAAAMLAIRSMRDLLAMWEMTTTMSGLDVFMVRGWLMDEFGRRNPEGFIMWLDDPEARDETLRSYMI